MSFFYFCSKKNSKTKIYDFVTDQSQKCKVVENSCREFMVRVFFRKRSQKMDIPMLTYNADKMLTNADIYVYLLKEMFTCKHIG